MLDLVFEWIEHLKAQIKRKRKELNFFNILADSFAPVKFRCCQYEGRLHLASLSFIFDMLCLASLRGRGTISFVNHKK